MQPYDYLREDSLFSLQLHKKVRRWLCHDVTFHSAHRNRYQKDNIAYGRYYMPGTGTRFPLVILLHGLGRMGRRDAMPCDILARDLAKAGIASFVLQLELPLQETEGGTKQQFSIPFVENWLELYQMLVINLRQVIDWAESRDELDAQSAAVIGMSMGGIAAAIAMAVDSRIGAGVFIVTGGNMEIITWKSKNEVARINHNCTRAQCHEVYRHYPQYLADVKKKGIDYVVPAKECFLFDPITFAPCLQGRPLLMINAERDDFVPRDSTLQLWEACGCPPMVWLPGEHNTIFLRYHSIRREVTSFLDSFL